jgi:hypothetical protein
LKPGAYFQHLVRAVHFVPVRGQGEKNQKIDTDVHELLVGLVEKVFALIRHHGLTEPSKSTLVSLSLDRKKCFVWELAMRFYEADHPIGPAGDAARFTPSGAGPAVQLPLSPAVSVAHRVAMLDPHALRSGPLPIAADLHFPAAASAARNNANSLSATDLPMCCKSVNPIRRDRTKSSVLHHVATPSSCGALLWNACSVHVHRCFPA